ncbi:hypothetical protein PR202_gb04770 [Eleusine coracana subsp. coracana]|uniref:Phytocyanin domain-containing protein n=1 Tax=Eleusine coracana subsp. coracana TaxID=191504 RepID=A0AAV5E5C4_ELECO|nr:hypothetical protein PR202_gb04770 [Eleusine coracana subsp. coracana]
MTSMMASNSKVRSSVACCWLIVLVVGFAAVVPSSEAHVFYAGGRDGWVVDPAESYNHWAERNRFQVNDTIVFTYDEAANSVLLVTEQDYDACNTRSPVRRLEAAGAGGSAFRFDRSGPFFFISGDEDRCQKGQKLYVIVMAPRATTRPAPAPGPGYSQEAAFPPFWAAAPEYDAQAPGIGGEVTSRESSGSSMGAPPPTAAATRVDEAIVVAGAAAGVLGALVLSVL